MRVEDGKGSPADFTCGDSEGRVAGSEKIDQLTGPRIHGHNLTETIKDTAKEVNWARIQRENNV